MNPYKRNDYIAEDRAIEVDMMTDSKSGVFLEKISPVFPDSSRTG